MPQVVPTTVRQLAEPLVHPLFARLTVARFERMSVAVRTRRCQRP